MSANFISLRAGRSAWLAFVSGLLLTAACALATTAVDVVVPGYANPYLAGMPNGSTAASGDSAPGQSPVEVTGLNLSAGASLFFDASGSVNYGGGTPTTPTDGESFWTHGVENGIAEAVYPLNTLVGIFLDDSVPTDSAVPPRLDFSPGGNVVGGVNYKTLSPALKQVFFIGDGRADDNAVQQVIVPEGATRLFLGTTDGSGWYNNTGAFNVHVAQEVASDPVTLSVALAASSTSDPSGTATHIGEDITYTFTASVSGTGTARNLQLSAQVPAYIENQSNLNKQFTSGDLTLGDGATFHPETTPGAKDARITWNCGDVAANASVTRTFTLHIGNAVRTLQEITFPNNYAISSTSFQPATPATGYSSGSPNVRTDIRDPISFTLTANAATVAPGGLFTYTATLSNLSASSIGHAVAVIVVPEFSRFVRIINTGANRIKSKQVYYSGSTDAQIVIDAGALAAAGDLQHKDTTTFEITFQAQWADPAETPAISGVEYGAAFLKPAEGENNPYADFAAAFSAAGTTPSRPGNTDFMALIQDASRNIAMSRLDSGAVDLALQGSLDHQPRLMLTKTLSNRPADSDNDDSGDSANTVRPGDTLTFLFAVANNGDSPAEDVYVQDRMPDSTSFVSAGTLGTNQSAKMSRLDVVRDADGHHIRLEGLHLEPHDCVLVQYTVKVASGGEAPAAGTTILPRNDRASSVGTSSSMHTPVGVYVSDPVRIIDEKLFARPSIRTLVARPIVSADINATASALNAIYGSNPSALPLTSPSDFDSFVPGVQRYYIHYKNMGATAAQGVNLNVPLPAHTVFYRASFMALPPNAAQGMPGYLPGTLMAAPNGASVSTPGFLTSGSVNFHFNSLPSGIKGEGDVMVEVVITPDAIQTGGSLVGDPNAAPVTIGTAAPQQAGMRHVLSESSAMSLAFQSQPVRSSAVPKVGIWKSIPREVKQGAEFQVQLIVFNHGEINANPIVEFTVPANAEFVSADAGQSYISSMPAVGSGPGHTIGAVLASNNGPIYPDDRPRLQPHSAAALTVTLKATGPAGSDIPESAARVTVDDMGRACAPATSTRIVQSPAPGMIQAVAGNPVVDVIVNGRDALLMNLGGGNIVAQGAGNIVAQGGGNIVAQGGGNIVATGGGNLIPVGSSNGGSLLSNWSSIVAQGAGNIVIPQGSSIVAQGGGNIVASGAGNIVAQGGGNIVAQGGGNIVAQGGGNIVAQGAGNIVAQGAGNIVASGGGNIVAQGAGNILSSASGSTASLITPGGNIVATGGGNFRPQ